MRIDKYLKVSRLIKRRSIASEACSTGRVSVNGIVVKPSFNVSINDIIEITFGESTTKIKVIALKESTKKEDAELMYEILN